jgi:hypothetical protein
MQSSEEGLLPVVLRRALAVVECAVVGGLLIVGSDLLKARRVEGDGIATGFAWLVGALFILVSPAVAAAAVTAWLGRQRWWAWQAVMVLWAAVLPVGTILLLMISITLFG